MSVDASLLSAFAAVAEARPDEALSRHTTIGIGGPADAYAVADNETQLSELLRLAHESAMSVFVLGSGSNIVVGDKGIRGLVIENKANATTTPALMSATDGGDGSERYLVRAYAGASFALLARHLAFDGFAGLEWACGIPGTLGGAVVYNAGAYGGCLGDVLLRIAVWDSEGGESILQAGELGLVYRGSAFTRGLMRDKAVLWAEFALWRGDESELRARIQDYDGRRLKAQPRGRNAGSFFKNPPEQPAWKLIDAVGMRGYRIGGAQFSDKHCNFLINAGDAKASDVASLKNEAQRRVFDQFGLRLENEVSLVGEGFDE
jgi:UDP-N-acetylmuramate dehydrogenase